MSRQELEKATIMYRTYTLFNEASTAEAQEGLYPLLVFLKEKIVDQVSGRNPVLFDFWLPGYGNPQRLPLC
jgi:hypothetical protein